MVFLPPRHPERVVDLPEWYVSEDFVFYTQRMPGIVENLRR